MPATYRLLQHDLDDPEPEYVQTVVAVDPSGASEMGAKSDLEMKRSTTRPASCH
jgi:hypothetical protein